MDAAEGGAWVVLRNEGGVGIADASVAATCGEESVEIAFHDVPASASRRAFVACDGPVEATLAWWQEA